MDDENKYNWNLKEDHSPENILAAEFIPSIPDAHAEALVDLEKQVLIFEKGDEKSKEESKAIIKRILHTLKGDFGVMGLDKFVELVHHIEELYLSDFLNSDTLLQLKDFLENSFSFFKEGRVPLIDDDVIVKVFQGHWDEDALDSNSEKKIGVVDKIENDQERELTALNTFIDDPSILQDFIIESGEQLRDSLEILNKIASSEYNEEDVNTLFRSCHTLKGIAGFLNLVVTQSYAHALENLLSLARKNELIIIDHTFDVIQLAFDHLEGLILAFAGFLETHTLKLPQGLAENKAAMLQISDIGEVHALESSLDLIKPVITETIPINEVEEKTTEIFEKSANVTEVNNNLEIKKNNNLTDDTIRVGTKRLDLLIDSIGETVIAFSMLEADHHIKHANDLMLEKKMAQADFLIRQLQEISMSLRMVPVNTTFQKMTRIVRDLSKKLDKKVQLITSGEDTELDKTVVEKIGDPLMHMVRNSLDHGIETKEERAESGKNPTATIWLRSYNKGGNIYIEIEDDGRGIPRKRILEKAIHLGLITEEAGHELSDSEVFRFIFHPGFSTAAQVTDISGRGVGMDVVKKNIEELRGTISIESILGKGTLFSIRLPLTMAIIDGMVINDSNEKYIIPTLNIVTTIAMSADEILLTPQGERYLEIQEEYVKVIELTRLLRFDEYSEFVGQKVIVVIEDSIGGKLGLIVDEIIGQQQIVIKGFGNWLGEIPGISGGAIMNDGNVSLIVDIIGLMKLYSHATLNKKLEMI